jgi:hypothetical protein
MRFSNIWQLEHLSLLTDTLSSEVGRLENSGLTDRLSPAAGVTVDLLDHFSALANLR